MPYQHLTKPEREIIGRMRSNGTPVTEIAALLERSRSTIYRELHRNRSRRELYGEEWFEYHGAEAQIASERRRRERPLTRKMDDEEVRQFVNSGLEQDWSPEQISGRLASSRGECGLGRSVTFQTIYTWIWQENLLSVDSSHRLRRGGRPYRRQGPSFRGRFPLRKRIEERPKVVDLRERIGDWEGDTIHGSRGSGYIITYVDRKTGYLLASKMPRLSSQKLTDASLRLFSKLAEQQKQTITVDNGVEFSDHLRLTRLSGLEVYFARPYCSTDRATNENTNGLLRQYFPKGMDFAEVTPQKLSAAVKRINNRPRKRLNYKTPDEVFNHYSQDCRT